MKRYWKVGIVLLCLVCMGCGGNASQSLPNPTFLYAFDGDGKSKEHPMYTTIEELNAHPEKYRDNWVFFQGYMENTSLRIIQNTHTPTLVDRKINPDIQYAVILDVTNMEAFEQETAIRAYIKGYGTEAVVQTKAYFTWEYLEYFQKEIACIKVEEMRLTEWVEDAS